VDEAVTCCGGGSGPKDSTMSWSKRMSRMSTEPKSTKRIQMVSADAYFVNTNRRRGVIEDEEEEEEDDDE
jgi:hypothetical protein